jgi:hypothetical protein
MKRSYGKLSYQQAMYNIFEEYVSCNTDLTSTKTHKFTNSFGDEVSYDYIVVNVLNSVRSRLFNNDISKETDEKKWTLIARFDDDKEQLAMMTLDQIEMPLDKIDDCAILDSKFKDVYLSKRNRAKAFYPLFECLFEKLGPWGKRILILAYIRSEHPYCEGWNIIDDDDMFCDEKESECCPYAKRRRREESDSENEEEEEKESDKEESDSDSDEE